jgi:hypothetical protein
LSKGLRVVAHRRPTHSIGLRAALLVGVSLGALSIGFGGMSSADAADVKVPGATKAKVLKAPPLPPPPTWFFSAEGGAACSGSNIAVRSRFVPGVDLARVGNACGWTTRLGFGQENTALFGGIADYWGVFVRYTRIQDSAPVNGIFGTFFPAFAGLYPYSFNANSGFDERRTVIDFEAGRGCGVVLRPTSMIVSTLPVPHTQSAAKSPTMAGSETWRARSLSPMRPTDRADGTFRSAFAPRIGSVKSTPTL